MVVATSFTTVAAIVATIGYSDGCSL